MRKITKEEALELFGVDISKVAPTDVPDDLTTKLEEMVAAMVKARPDLREDQAMNYLLHTSHGRSLANHLNNLSKGETKQMTRSEEMQEMKKFVKEGGMAAMNKYILEKGSTSLTEHEYAECVQEDAKRKGISFEKAMDWQTYAVVREAGYVRALDFTKGMA